MRSGWVLAAFLAAAVSAADARADGAWTDQIVDGIPEFSFSDSAMQLDAAGHPHIFVGGDKVYHYWLDGGTWRSEVVDPQARSGGHLRAATGPGGEFHLVYDHFALSPYSTPSNPEAVFSLRYATNLGGGWTFDTVPDPTSVEEVSGLVVDASHQPHLLAVSIGVSADAMVHIYRASSGWTIEPLDAQGTLPEPFPSDNFWEGSSLAIDGAGVLHAIWHSGPQDLTYSRRDGSGWHHQSLVSVAGQTLSFTANQSSIVVDPPGNAHVFADVEMGGVGGPFRLLHLTDPQGTWQAEDLGPGAPALAAAIDAAGFPALVTISGSALALGYSALSSQGWSPETFAVADSGALVSLRVDPSGAPQVAMLDRVGVRRLLYLTYDSSWITVDVAHSGAVEDDLLNEPFGPALVGADVRLALVGGLRHLAYREGGEETSSTLFGQVHHAVEGAGGFAIDLLPFTGPYPLVDPGSIALAASPAGGDEVTWFVNGQVETSVLDGSPPVLSPLALPGGASAAASRRPAIDFAEPGLFQLFFAGGAPGNTSALADETSDGPATYQVISPSVPPRVADFSFDVHGLAVAPAPLGALQVAFVDQDGQVVRATNSTGTWTTEIVGRPQPNTRIDAHALALEPDGTVHIAYHRSTADGPFQDFQQSGLAYGTTRCGPGFAVTDVDALRAPNDVTGPRNPDLVLDANGNPHISYRRSADRSLAHAFIHAGLFTHETAVPDTDSGENSAIGVTPDGVVSIAHYDPWAGDLRLATRAPIELEPQWDGCPPLPDPNAGLHGDYVIDIPSSALPFYGPELQVTTSYGATHAAYALSLGENGVFDVQGTADTDGDSVTDATVVGTARLSGNDRQARMVQSLEIIGSNLPVPPAARIRVIRREEIDLATRRRSVTEVASGVVAGQRVHVRQSSSDQLPAQDFGVLFYLNISQSGNQLAAIGDWVTQSGVIEFSGTGSWIPASQSANLVLTAPGFLTAKLSGLHLWHVRGDGVHLRVDRIFMRGLGQTMRADLRNQY